VSTKPTSDQSRRDQEPPENGFRPRPVPVQRLELAGVRRSVLVVLAVAILIPVAVVVYVLANVGGSKSPANQASAKPGPHILDKKTIAHTQNPLLKAVAGINVSMTGKGLLPPSTCKVMSATLVSCSDPTPAIDTVTFRTFTNMTSLYAAYESTVSSLAAGPFRANFGNCTETSTNGEVGWNHDFKHPAIYSVSDFTSGHITDDEAAGRVYCTFDNSMLHLVWTQDDGDVLGELSGAPHLDAYVWWRQVHHSVVLPGFPGMNTQDMKNAPKSMQNTTTTTGATSTRGTTGTMTTMGSNK
jgi:hypothetical protein